MRALVLALALLATVGGSALAGMNAPGGSVVINAGSRFASVLMGGARNSPDATQYLGCSTYYYAPSPIHGISCYLRDASGASAYCYSYNREFIKIVAGLTLF